MSAETKFVVTVERVEKTITYHTVSIGRSAVEAYDTIQYGVDKNNEILDKTNTPIRQVRYHIVKIEEVKE